MGDAHLSLSQVEAVLRGRAAREAASPGRRQASVLVPFVLVAGSPHVALTRRSRALRRHAGEIAFPGGMREAADGSPERTAVRETVEELGVPESDVSIWGELDPIVTSTGYSLSVFTGNLRDANAVRPSPREVEELLLVPLEHLLDPSTVRDETRIGDGRPSSQVTYSYNGQIVWGATARILAGLLRILREARSRASDPGTDREDLH